ncbi:TetR/AcrR family transcriptional regulator [Thalassotalea sp. PLHSN55]|uniref:TetR/AcrR family transcriptional regulator n=1 Tax=Thalassotalea sp. PLHSN55 TaxID=3435888 RepID=UPI003F8550C7
MEKSSKGYLKLASGRKREFDETTAIEAAMHVFWQKGYVGASLTDLTQSMGINKPSMYSAFGNKEALFIRAAEHYLATKMQACSVILLEPTVPLFTRLKNYMMTIVAMQCDPEQPKGCFLALCQSELAGGDIPEQATMFLTSINQAPKNALSDLFQHDAEAITLGLNTHANAIALSLYTLLKGTASMARSGFSVSELEHAIDNMLSGIRLKYSALD